MKLKIGLYGYYPQQNEMFCSFWIFFGKMAEVFLKCGFLTKWTSQRIRMKLKVWGGWYARSVDFNLWSKQISWDEMNWPWIMAILPMLDCLSYWFCPNSFCLLIVLVIISRLQWQWWFGIPINNIEELIDYQLEVKRWKVKGIRSLLRFIQNQPLQLGSSNLAYLSAVLRRGEKSGHSHIGTCLLLF